MSKRDRRPTRVALLLAWLAYQTDVALNEGLTRRERIRWHATMFVLPYLVTLYWARHVRPRRVP